MSYGNLKSGSVSYLADESEDARVTWERWCLVLIEKGLTPVGETFNFWLLTFISQLGYKSVFFAVDFGDVFLLSFLSGV